MEFGKQQSIIMNSIERKIFRLTALEYLGGFFLWRQDTVIDVFALVMDVFQQIWEEMNLLA